MKQAFFFAITRGGCSLFDRLVRKGDHHQIRIINGHGMYTNCDRNSLAVPCHIRGCRDICVRLECRSDSAAQLGAQSVTGHRQQILTGLAGWNFQVLIRWSLYKQHLQTGIDQNSRRCITIHKQFLAKVGKTQTLTCPGGTKGGRGQTKQW